MQDIDEIRKRKADLYVLGRCRTDVAEFYVEWYDMARLNEISNHVAVPITQLCGVLRYLLVVQIDFGRICFVPDYQATFGG